MLIFLGFFVCGLLIVCIFASSLSLEARSILVFFDKIRSRCWGCWDVGAVRAVFAGVRVVQVIITVVLFIGLFVSSSMGLSITISLSLRIRNISSSRIFSFLSSIKPNLLNPPYKPSNPISPTDKLPNPRSS